MHDIIIRGLNKAYGENPVLRDFACRFPGGEITCLMAPSGYGKTTLLRLLTGLEAADSGSIEGMEKMHLCVLFQEDRLCENLDAQANLRLVNPALSRKKALQLLAEAGIDAPADQKVAQFSGGMKRRVALMRALCAEGDVLILDEPFKGLDGDTRLRMIRCLLAHRRGRTAILVTHDEADAEDLHAHLLRMEGCNRA